MLDRLRTWLERIRDEIQFHTGKDILGFKEEPEGTPIGKIRRGRHGWVTINFVIRRQWSIYIDGAGITARRSTPGTYSGSSCQVRVAHRLDGKWDIYISPNIDQYHHYRNWRPEKAVPGPDHIQVDGQRLGKAAAF